MISISGIKYQEELEKLPYFNKQTAAFLIGKRGKNLDKKIAQLMGKGYLRNLKKGLYVTTTFVDRTDKVAYAEHIANILCFPSYLSLEYVLAKEGVIPEGVVVATSVTLKSSRSFTNFLGSYTYRNIKSSLFFGFKEKQFEKKTILIASRAKALFDFLYLKKLFDLKQDLLKDLRLNWDALKPPDWKNFEELVATSGSYKMRRIYQALKEKVL